MNKSFAFCILLIPATPSLAQTTVYKCQSDRGTVYSGQPCGQDAEEIILKGDHQPSAESLQRLDEARQFVAERRWKNQLVEQEANCINGRVSATRRGTKQRIDAMQAEIRNLQHSMAYSANNLAGATRTQGLQQRVASLQAAINTQQNILANTILNARTVCAHQRRQTAARHTRADKPRRPAGS